MDPNKFFQSKIFKIVLLGIAGLIVVLFIFKIGMFIGFRKANFSYKWGENYHQNFGGPRGGLFKNFSGRDFIDANGVFGQIIKIEGSTLVIKGGGDVEKLVLVKDDTVIKRFQDNVKLADLKVDEYIVVIGEPNDAGQIEAKLIRLLPAPPKEASFRQFSPPLPWQ